MFPLLINSEDRRGGAARAAHRLHLALREIGVDARMLVQVKHGDEASVMGSRDVFGQLIAPLRPAADLLPTLFYPRRTKATFYPGWLPDSLTRRVGKLAPDLLHLHWISGGALNVRSLRRFRCPVVWTLHDMWAFTGGCHYDEGCGRYTEGCGRCPILGSSRNLDLSRLGWWRKRKAYRNARLRIVTPSRWLAGLAGDSPLLSRLPITVIPNPVDTRIFRPIARQVARDLLGLPQQCQIVLFGALRSTSERRKGFHLLQPALQALSRRQAQRKLCAVVFGASRPQEPVDFGMESVFVGTLADDIALALAYSAADVFVAPSTQENLSNAVMEALACGTPVVAFDVGGMPDMIEHRENGYLAQPFDPSALADGLQWVLEDDARRARLAERARAKVLEEFEMSRVARRYLALYQEILAVGPGTSAQA
ncbi:MAG TPA: glycosyltransferase family 4 protein [Burkholderiales bacterium]|jgi:glycosyltransferase involved in cell wall biosynthesis|nr:glycosyltransferase family 4 protein [Burkholderiales bacterium]